MRMHTTEVGKLTLESGEFCKQNAMIITVQLTRTTRLNRSAILSEYSGLYLILIHIAKCYCGTRLSARNHVTPCS